MIDFETKAGCVFTILLLVIAFVVGAVCAQYIIWALWGTTINFFLAGLAGLLSGELALPVAVILLILKSAGVVEFPMLP